MLGVEFNSKQPYGRPWVAQLPYFDEDDIALDSMRSLGNEAFCKHSAMPTDV